MQVISATIKTVRCPSQYCFTALLACFALSQAPVRPALGQESGTQPGDARTETVVAEDSKLATVSGRSIETVAVGLSMPTAVAIQPESGEVFVAESGAGRVVRLTENGTEPVVVDFPTETLTMFPHAKVGPLSLGFLNRDTLIVGTGGMPAGEDSIRVYTLADPPATMKFDGSRTSFQVSADTLLDHKAEGDFVGMAVAPNAVFWASQADQEQGWVLMSTRSTTDVIGSPSRLIATSPKMSSALPCGITVSPHGYLLVSNIGQLNDQRDSVAAFFDTNSKKLLMKLPLDLWDAVALAYSPRRQLYVLDMAANQPENGGLYRIIELAESDSGLQLNLIARLPAPSAMSFDSDGALYITLLGDSQPSGNGQGRVIRIPSSENL